MKSITLAALHVLLVVLIFILSSIHAAADTCIEGDCADFTAACEEVAHDWYGAYTLWNTVIAEPVVYTRTRGGIAATGAHLLWMQPSTQSGTKWPPLRYHACWGEGDFPDDCEFVLVDENGEDDNPGYHDSIVFWSATNCNGLDDDNFRHLDGGEGPCLYAVSYNFELRDDHPIHGCYKEGWVYLLNPAPGLIAKNSGDSCDSNSTDYAWIASPYTRVECGVDTALYRYGPD